MKNLFDYKFCERVNLLGILFLLTQASAQRHIEIVISIIYPASFLFIDYFSAYKSF